MKKKFKISFVVAVYQNRGSVSETHRQICALFNDQLAGFSYEIIFVDDGSTDGSLDEAISLKEIDKHVKILSFTRNFGQMSAIVAGLREAAGEAIINVSADLQDPINLVPEMIGKWQDGAEIVICHRQDRHDDLLSTLFSKFAYSIMRLSVPKIPPGGFDYFLFDRGALDVFNSMNIKNRFLQADVLWSGHRTCFIPYTRLARTIGTSQYNFSRKFNAFVDSIIASSYLPIRAMSLLGIITSLLGLLYSFSIFVSWMFGRVPFKGWAPIMVVILVVGGVIMTMLGVIGEYIWRINEEVRKRPDYIIRKKYE